MLLWEIHGTFWQLTGAISSSTCKWCEQVLLPCWHCLRSEYICGWMLNFFLFIYLFFLSRLLLCPVFQTQQVAHIHWSARKRLLRLKLWFYLWSLNLKWSNETAVYMAFRHIKRHKDSALIDMNSEESGCDFIITIIINITGLLV